MLYYGYEYKECQRIGNTLFQEGADSMHIPEKIHIRLAGFGKQPTEHVLYWVSIWCIIILGVIYMAMLYFVEKTGFHGILECKMKRTLGLPCPGCGGTRALWYLLHGRILSALYYHAFAVYGAIWYLMFFITQTLQRITRGRLSGIQFRDKFLYIAIVILIAQYILKLLIPGYIV